MENEISLPPPEFKAANPGPLGFAGFGLTTVVLSCVNAGILSLGSARYTTFRAELAALSDTELS
jgi:succinate-acetate transporter protein